MGSREIGTPQTRDARKLRPSWCPLPLPHITRETYFLFVWKTVFVCSTQFVCTPIRRRVARQGCRGRTPRGSHVPHAPPLPLPHITPETCPTSPERPIFHLCGGRSLCVERNVCEPIFMFVCKPIFITVREFAIHTRAQRELLHTWIILVNVKKHVVQVGRIDGHTEYSA